MRVDVDDETVSSLERILNSPPPPGRVLPLPVCLEELSESLRDPRPTWKGQRHSLLDDLNASVKDVGPKLRVATRASLDALTQSVTRALAPPEPDAVANRTTRTATEQLAEQLQRPAALHAAWQDLVTGLRNQLRTDTVLQRLRLLLAMATAAHHNSDQLRRDLHSIIAGHTLSGPPQAETDSGTTSAAERLAECQERIALPARSGHCVVWLTFSGTLANSTYEVAEPMAFFQSEWAVPNAQQEDGQDVPHRDELKRIEDRLWGAPCEPDVVLVRVDLGERPAAEALDDGWRQAALVVGRAALRARARPWKPLGWHALLLDEQGSVESFATEDQLGLLPNPHERRAVANALSEVAPSMAGDVRRLPTQLHEAVDIAVQAARAELRSRIVLRFRVVELVASHMAIKDTDHLLKRIQGSWAFSEVQHVLNWRIYLTLVEPVVGIGRGEQAALARAILTPAGTDGGVRVDYDRANQLADALLNLSRCDLDRSALRDALTLSTDGLAYMGRVRELERIERLLCSRVVRIRNAITHGNAFTLAAALSVDNYLLYLTELLLDEAIKAAVTGQTLASLLDTRKKDRQTFGDRLNGGARLADVIKPTG